MATQLPSLPNHPSRFRTRTRSTPGQPVAVPKLATVHPFPTAAVTTGAIAETDTNGLGAVRGTRLILAIELAAGLCVYGLWEVWHLLHL